MTPQERQLIDQLFERLARVESTPRDREAAEAIAEGLRRAPNAVYTLVQTVLLQDEALRRADARIQELEADDQHQPERGGSFLDTMRDSLFGRDEPRGSVPSVRPSEPNRAAWNTGQVLPRGEGPDGYDQPNSAPGGFNRGGFGQGGIGQPTPGAGGGSFLGTAAAAAAGVVGGSLLLSSIRGMMGGDSGGNSGGAHQSLADTSGGSGGPWGSSGSGGDLARDAGVNDIGSSQRADNSADRGGDESSRTGLFDQASNDHDDMDMDDDFDDGGDSDYA
uniref:Putative periplasmic ligand-binding sensor protein n=1 Tax=Rhodopseudomonas palustris (strain BisA53) TaxID=316055 RepID=Q07TB0_RHOP5